MERWTVGETAETGVAAGCEGRADDMSSDAVPSATGRSKEVP
jgi:hypothetical protein